MELSKQIISKFNTC